MKIQILSNIHGNLPELEECDLLILNGNISPVFKQSHKQLMEHWLMENFVPWVVETKAKNVVFVPGEYDIVLSPKNKSYSKLLNSILTLTGSKMIIPIGSKSNKIVGFPYQLSDNKFKGFSCDEEKFKKELNKLPDNIQTLICNTDLNCDVFKTFVEEKKPKLIITNTQREKPRVASKHMNTVILQYSYCQNDFETPFDNVEWIL